MTPHKLSSLLREAGVLALLALLFYLAVALLTYSPADPGPTHTGSGHGILNLGGKVGAWFADWMFAAFGRMAYLCLLLLCAFGWRMRGRRELRAHNAYTRALPALGFVLAMLGACGLEHLYWPTDALNAGGIIGQYSAASLLAGLGALGVTVLFLAMLFTGITLFLHLSWFALMDRIGYRAFAVAKFVTAQVEARADPPAGERTSRSPTATVKKFRDELGARKPPKIAPKITAAAPSTRKMKESQTNLFVDPAPGMGGELPPLSLLEAPSESVAGYSRDELETMSRLLVKKLKDFSVDVVVEAVQPGPVITRFEVEPAPGIKSSQIVGLSRDLARSLSVESVRVVDNIAGKTVIGLEIPNQNRETVRLVEGLSSQAYDHSASPLTLVLGKDIAGSPAIADLIKMPHLLIAGTTGSGKSVCINALILSILYKATPEQVRMIMVDPKFLELSVYDGIPHLLAPVVTDMEKAANALRWCIGEMDRRFRVMAALNVRSIVGYNKQVARAIADGAPLADPMAPPPDDSDAPVETLRPLPYVVVVVDELADLMMVAGKKIEAIIIRIAQRARAAGIHLVLATQRPSVDVVTGLIKANVPTRIAFQVSSRADSRTVIDQMGAEQLLGQGDMLYMPPGSSMTQRVHGSFVSDEEVAEVVAHLKRGGAPVYLEQVTDGAPGGAFAGDGASSDDGGESDPLYDEAVRFVTQSRRASISSLQRALRVGYNRAARMIETMEESGVVSPNDNGKREVLAPSPPEG
ncbi:MAG: DNA translocase FtsK [bacterium]